VTLQEDQERMRAAARTLFDSIVEALGIVRFVSWLSKVLPK